MEHPDIRSALLTGYPRYSQPKEYYCQECGRDITDEKIYEDEEHEYLCEDCLLSAHEKRWN